MLSPQLPGGAEHTPRAKPHVLLIIAGLLALQVVARYRWGFLSDSKWQLAHLIIGWSGCALVLTLFHGPSLLRRVTRRTWTLLAIGACCFLLFWYFGRMDAYRKWWAEYVPPTGPMGPVYSFISFSLGGILFRLLLPFSIAWFAFKLSPAALGLYAPGNPYPPAVRRIWPLYVALFLVVIPFVIGVAGTAGFQAKYPMARAMIGPDLTISLEHLIVYELFYLGIFVSGESFWRGYLTFGTERDLGLYGLMFMIVPYVTAHFGKPLPETLGAILAGFTLGWLALKHRSVWLGVALHYSIALSMDLLAIRAKGIEVLW